MLAGLQAIDGVTLLAGDRVLVKDQIDQTTNGLYAASTGNWKRTSDAATNAQFADGMAVNVAQGALNAGLSFLCTCLDDPVVIGTSLLIFAAQSTVATATQTATSTTSLTIGTGSKTFTIQASKAFKVGQWVLAQETSSAANQMLGQITAYAGTSLTISVAAIGGTGTSSLDGSGLLEYFVTFTVSYDPPGVVAGDLTADVDVPIGLLSSADAEIGRTLVEQAEALVDDTYTSLVSMTNG